MGNLTKADESTSIGADLLRCSEVAKRLIVSECTLAQWRRLKRGPRFIRLGGRVVRYRAGDVAAWLVAQEVAPSRLVGLNENSGLGQYFQNYERRAPEPDRLDGAGTAAVNEKRGRAAAEACAGGADAPQAAAAPRRRVG